MPATHAFFLVGPTASGKTAVAHALALRLSSLVLSADSMLVYQGMDIGTAKPSRRERGEVRYWGVDVVAPGESYSVARFLGEAVACFREAARLQCPVIVVGGTGLYIKALTRGLDPLPEIPSAVREHWRRVAAEEGVAGLQEALRQRHPAWLEALEDPGNPRRLQRALELHEAGVQGPPAEWAQGARTAVLTGLLPSREILLARLTARVDEMYRDGLLEEVSCLLAAPGGLSATAAQAIGYAEAAEFLAGRATRGEAIERTCRRTRQLAKRQLTWFRHQATMSWIPLESGDDQARIEARVWADWQRLGAQPVILPEA